MQGKINNYFQFSDRLVAALKSRGFTSNAAASGVRVKELSEAVGISNEMARRYASGEAEPTNEAVKRKIAEWLNISYSWLVTGDGEMIQESKNTAINSEHLKKCIKAVKDAAKSKGITLTEDQIINTAIYLYEERDLDKASSLVSLLA